MKKSHKKKRITPGKAAIIAAIAGGVYMAMGWPFFYFITYGGKKEKTDKFLLPGTEPYPTAAGDACCGRARLPGSSGWKSR